MRRAARFALPLVLGLALVTWIASVLVQRKKPDWFKKDLALRAELAVIGSRRALSQGVSGESRSELNGLLSEIARDERNVGGNDVVDLLPSGAPHKGIALERQRARFGCDTAIYVGDDDTNEDVFTLDQPGRLLAIRVGRKRGSAAQYHVPSQRAVDPLLRALIAIRRNSVDRRDGAR